MSVAEIPNVWPNSYALAMTCVPLPHGDRLPEWVELLPFGNLALFVGEPSIRVAFVRHAASVIVNTLAHQHLFATDGLFVAFPYAAESEHEIVPSAGRINEFERRPSGIWGRVEWTRRGVVTHAGRRFPTLGTIVAHKRDGEIERIAGAAFLPPPNRDRRDGGPFSPQPVESLKC